MKSRCLATAAAVAIGLFPCLSLEAEDPRILVPSEALPVEVLIGPDSPSFDSQPAPGPLNTPFAVEFDSHNRMWIVEFDGGRVLRCAPDNPTEPKVIAGPESASDANALGYVDGPAKQARFNKLHNLAIDDHDVLYLSDHSNHSVRRLQQNASGEWFVDTFAGTGKEGPSKERVVRHEATFHEPICVTLTPDRRRLLVADIGNQVVRSIYLETGIVDVLVGRDAKLKDPRAVDLDPQGRLLVLERNGNRLRRMDEDHSATVLAGNGKKGSVDGEGLASSFNGPKHMDVASDGRVFIADDVNHLVRVYDPQNGTVGTLNLGEYQLRRPHGVCIHDDQLYIADSFHHRILRVPLPTR
ncbi:hypothetical protein [Rhodopirellula halodulae]|uniref:hypothetical protein n=1 Tax=Rhodopirellula halodulae TaxID=2894198 RepID=UPI001E337EDE|nr:hypothetical protein [Rhodopirellula sp. JC737]MCC9658866.1 hypothetical protein [Rhodopirellula sp. JC737]